jgi:hypothetical protein
VVHAADRQAPDVGRRAEVRDHGLQRVAGLVGRRGDRVDEQVEQRLEVLARRVAVQRGLPGLGVAEDVREVDLVLVGVEVEEELLDLGDDLVDARVGRSTLLTTSTIGSRASSALRSTKRVWGSGPSLASTSSSTPSTIVMPRSTSPPKSAWPACRRC